MEIMYWCRRRGGAEMLFTVHIKALKESSGYKKEKKKSLKASNRCIGRLNLTRGQSQVQGTVKGVEPDSHSGSCLPSRNPRKTSIIRLSSWVPISNGFLEVSVCEIYHDKKYKCEEENVLSNFDSVPSCPHL